MVVEGCPVCYLYYKYDWGVEHGTTGLLDSSGQSTGLQLTACHVQHRDNLTLLPSAILALVLGFVSRCGQYTLTLSLISQKLFVKSLSKLLKHGNIEKQVDELVESGIVMEKALRT